MADWKEGAHTAIIAVVFALMLSKLVSLLLAFKAKKLVVELGPSWKHKEAALPQSTYSGSSEHESSDGQSDCADVDVAAEVVDDEQKGRSDPLDLLNDGRLPLGTVSVVGDGGKEVAAEAESRKGVSVQEAQMTEPLFEHDSDEWEGVESTELEEEFGAASTFVATLAVGAGLKVSQDLQLQLYGLYKVATEGPCRTPPPSRINLTARAKWNAWQQLGNTSSEEAMACYVDLVSKMSPNWKKGSGNCGDEGDGNSNVSQGSGGHAKHHGIGGPVFSTLVSAEGSCEAGSVEGIHVCAKKGDTAGLLGLLEKGEAIDRRDSQGRTALHWAVDHGHLPAVELLLAKGAEMDARDGEGQTALHYATICEHEDVAKHLWELGADASAVDSDGVTPYGLRPKQWGWMAVVGS